MSWLTCIILAKLARLHIPSYTLSNFLFSRHSHNHCPSRGLLGKAALMVANGSEYKVPTDS